MLIKLAFVLNRSLSTLAFRVLFASSSDSLIVAPCCVSICAFFVLSASSLDSFNLEFCIVYKSDSLISFAFDGVV